MLVRTGVQKKKNGDFERNLRFFAPNFFGFFIDPKSNFLNRRNSNPRNTKIYLLKAKKATIRWDRGNYFEKIILKIFPGMGTTQLRGESLDLSDLRATSDWISIYTKFFAVPILLCL